MHEAVEASISSKSILDEKSKQGKSQVVSTQI